MFLKDKTRAVFYVRVSTKEQADKGYSIGAQKSQIAAYCKNKGYELVGGYADEGISGKGMDNRYGLLDLLEDSRNDEFDVVVIWKLSRLSRKLVDTLSIIEELNDNNVSLDSVSEKTDFSSTSGIFMTQVMASMNELERNVIAESVAMGHKAKAQKGLWNGNKVLGYNNVKGKNRKTSLVINPAEAEVIKRIYDSYLAGNGLRAIANDLNNKGYTTKRGNSFSSVAIRDILDNRLYKGDIVYGRKAKNIKELQGNPIMVQGQHEPIINPKNWDRVAQLRQIRSLNPEKSRTGANVLTGIIRCPQCSGHMVINNSYYKKVDGTKVKKKYYVCGSFKNKGLSAGCSSNGINAELAEQKVAERFSELIDSTKLLEHLLVKMQKESNEGKGQLEHKKQLLMDKVISCNNHILVYQEKMESEPKLSDIWEEAIRRLEIEIDEYKDEILNIDQRLKTDYSDYDIEQITTLVNALVQNAQGTDNKSDLKELYLAFIKEIQWAKETQKFDIQLHFNETNIAEYLGLRPDPDPDNGPLSTTDELNNTEQKNLPNGGFFLRCPIEIWV